MIDKLTKLFQKKIEERFMMNILDADKDQLTSYGFIVTKTNNSMIIMEKKNTFEECIPIFQHYIDRYGLDNFSLCILKPNNTVFTLFTDEWGYDQLHSFSRESKDFSYLKIIGSSKISRNKEAIYTKGEAFGKKLYLDEIAFRFFRYYVCYIAVDDDENNPDNWYTRDMIIEICHKNRAKAIQLFNKLAAGKYKL